MNCKSCQKKLDTYISGNLPADVKKDVRIHLNECSECSQIHAALLLTEKVINQERELKSNPFLVTRVMSQIESHEEILSTSPSYGITRILQPLFLTATIIMALFIGIYAGNSYQIKTTAQNRIPEELLLMDDASMESLNMIVTDEEINNIR